MVGRLKCNTFLHLLTPYNISWQTVKVVLKGEIFKAPHDKFIRLNLLRRDNPQTSAVSSKETAFSETTVKGSTRSSKNRNIRMVP